MTSKQHQPERDQRHPGRRLPSELASTPCRDREKLASVARPDHPLMAEILDALARTMINNDIDKRRLVEFKEGCRYGKFGKTKAYELIAQQRIKAYKLGRKTMIDLDSVDLFHASLPRVESRAS